MSDEECGLINLRKRGIQIIRKKIFFDFPPDRFERTVPDCLSDQDVHCFSEKSTNKKAAGYERGSVNYVRYRQ